MQHTKRYNISKWLGFTDKRLNLPSNHIFDAWRLKKLTVKEFNLLGSSPSNLSLNQLYYLSWFGLLAPTTHNSVPERFVLKPNTSGIEVWIDRKYILEHSDKTGRQATISIGCVVTNIEIAASCFGLASFINVFPARKEGLTPYKGKGKRYTLLLNIHLNKDRKNQEASWIDVILKRKVVRAEYNEKIKLPTYLVGEIELLIHKRFPQLSFFLITDRQGLYTLAKFQEIADRTVFENEAFSYELGRWLYSSRDGINYLGMRGREFGFDVAFSERLHRGLLKKERLLPDEIAAFASGGKMGIKSSSAVGIIAAPTDSTTERLFSGRALEYIALVLEKYNFSISIHAGIVEVERATKMLMSFLQTSKRPMVVFRIGKPLRPEDRNRPHSTRPNLDDILLH